MIRACTCSRVEVVVQALRRVEIDEVVSKLRRVGR